jgi:Flp pilus assembly protein TadG
MKPMKNRKRRAGTSLVESALTLGLYTGIVFSIFDFGYVMYMHQTVASRVQTAARYGALNPTDTAGMKNVVLYNSSAGSGNGIFGITSSNVTATRTGSGTTADRVTVTVTSFHYPMISPGFSGTAKAVSSSMPVEAN